jgi:hypothetical protein
MGVTERGEPAHTCHYALYSIMVRNKNLISELPI